MAKNDFNFKDSVEYDLYNSDFGNRILDEYTLLDKIHQGGTSQVFVIRNNVSNKLYILKTVNYNRSDFNLEFLKDIDHPGIVKVHNVFKTDKYWYVIKDFIEGENLEQKVDRDGAYDEEAVTDIAIELCDILDYLHNMGPSPLIYRDLKPSNLMMTPSGEIILIDLDSIRQFKKESQKDTIYIGTEGFASPEQFGFGQTDSRSDIYTLGTTLYHLLTSQDPTAEKLKINNIREIRKDISLHLAKIIEKCTMFNPDSRYQNIGELKKGLSGISSENILISFLYKAKLSITRKAIITVASILVAILLITLSISWYNLLILPSDNLYDHASADDIQPDNLRLEPKVTDIEYHEFIGASEPIINLDTHGIDGNEIINIRLEYDGNLVPVQYDTNKGELKLINTFYPANLLEISKEYSLSLTVTDNSIYRMKFTPMHQELKEQGEYRIIYMPSNPDKGFNYPYYLMLPSEESIKRNEGKKNYLLVEPYDGGEASDDLDRHIDLALKNVKNNSADISEELGLPRLVPVFIRPETKLDRNEINIHNLSKEAIFLDKNVSIKDINNEVSFDSLYRVDLQLSEMIKDANQFLENNNWNMEDDIFMWGRGLAGDFANRYTFLYPDQVKASFYQGLPISPISIYRDVPIEYPIGTANYKSITGRTFDLKTYNEVAKLGFIFAKYDDSIRNDEDDYQMSDEALVNRLLKLQEYPAKWQASKDI
ncbi:MAG TPA: serine/threonine protein kinase [Clostridiales bacterium]|nr:serine/threonine protein kinase [Clostridiales bacterium]